jgi:uncharacterized protein
VSTLRDRLTRLKGTDSKGPNDSSIGERARTQALGLESRAARKQEQEASSSPILTAGPEWDALGVYPVMTEAGSFLRRQTRYTPDYKHGHYQLGALVEAAASLSAMTGSHRPPVSAGQLLFIDTETTGLGIGAGNVPFMIGVGLYQNEEFLVEQLFIRHPGEEAAMLTYLQELLGACSAIVSYNGRTFDWPIIRNRFVMNRLRLMKEEPLHLDFLYPSRSLWRNTLESCRLSRVEEDRLGIFREEDVPGSLAPTLYFQYLAEGNAEVLRGVFEHNERDIMTLATLAVHLAKAIEGELETEAMDAEEAYRLGLWLDKLGRTACAEQVMEQLAQRDDEQLHGHLNELAAWYKKNGEWEAAVSLWSRSVRREGSRLAGSLEPYIELAMYYEHRMKDPRSALEYALEARELHQRRQSFTRTTTAAKWRAEAEQLERRVDRLGRKLAAGGEKRGVSGAPGSQ